MTEMVVFFRDQHVRALTCAQAIMGITESEDQAMNKAEDIRFLLAQLTGILKPHLASEDHILYPALMASKDAYTAQTAKSFWEEIGPITQAVIAFLELWRRPGQIEKDPAKFKSESDAIFAALKKRIDAEEKELYPLFEKLF